MQYLLNKGDLRQMKKQIYIAIAFILAALLLAGCASSSSASSAPASQAASTAAAASTSTSAASGQLTLTKTQLSQYNGQNGQPAYVAVNGVIYDVSSLPQWQGGQHNGHTAGTDISDAFKTLPSGQAQQMLKGVPVVGKLVG
jgi:predicted heme/steroid binding protein